MIPIAAAPAPTITIYPFSSVDHMILGQLPEIISALFPTPSACRAVYPCQAEQLIVTAKLFITIPAALIPRSATHSNRRLLSPVCEGQSGSIGFAVVKVREPSFAVTVRPEVLPSLAREYATGLVSFFGSLTVTVTPSDVLGFPFPSIEIDMKRR